MKLKIEVSFFLQLRLKTEFLLSISIKYRYLPQTWPLFKEKLSLTVMNYWIMYMYTKCSCQTLFENAFELISFSRFVDFNKLSSLCLQLSQINIGVHKVWVLCRCFCVHISIVRRLLCKCLRWFKIFVHFRSSLSLCNPYSSAAVVLCIYLSHLTCWTW